jgi:hypothetical protein
LTGSPLAGGAITDHLHHEIGVHFRLNGGIEGWKLHHQKRRASVWRQAGNDLAALSSLNDNPVGTESDVQRMVDGVPVPPGLRVRRLQKAQLPCR